ncbi:putative aminotransferase [Lachnellula subtilissima]|uniref:Putative aminotransferase n=1 Tax=Lachnellula subtilissima TaxID=602034 RepID=A0A8H8RTE6_9HELO|nr:putative aminotransferase [Lachnellula subtilissima]
MGINRFVADSNVLHRALIDEPFDVVSGDGVILTLASGREIIDGSAGPAVSCLGHNRPDIVAAVAAQMNKIAYVYSGSRFRCEASEALATFILKNKPGNLVKAIFVNSGSEATDAAIKLATQYWHEKGEPARRNFISRKQSYHGNTLGALSVSGHASRRALYADWVSHNVSFVDPCYAYRGKADVEETDEQYVARLKQQLDDEFQRLGPNTVAAFFAETISGTTLGCLTAVSGYFKAVREVCDKYGALLVLDEIMCGMGRSGTMHAWEQEGISGPDIQTIGKGLGGGFVPLSGVLLNQKIFDGLAHGSKKLMHGHTFQAHPTACAGALAVQQAVEKENILQNVRNMGVVLENELRKQLTDLPLVGDIRGRGLFWSVEFVTDKDTKKSFEETENFSTRIVDRSLELGLNILGNLGNTGEYYVDHVLLSPPYIIRQQEILTIVGILKQAVNDVSSEYFSNINRVHL